MAQGNWGECSSECPVEKGGCQCIFPFKFGGITHNACTLHRSQSGEPWCSLRVDDKGRHIPGSWAVCSSECPVEEGCQCVFPFLAPFPGSSPFTAAHNACTRYKSRQISNGNPWCANKIDGQGRARDWFACKQECPIEEGCLTTDDAKCIFPFEALGIKHDACTLETALKPWCSIKNDENGTVVHSGKCNKDCPVEGDEKGKLSWL